MKLNTTNVLLSILGITLILCFILMIMDNKNSVENFDPLINAIQDKLSSESPEQLKSTVKALQQRLIDYGYAPDLDKYVTKTQLGVNDGKCLVSNAEDRDKYLPKSDVPPPGPRIDLSQYVKKSSIPPEKVCPSMPEIDYSQYVKKSTLPPNEKCPPCISPKVKVSAGLCRECPPAPSCPPPERCPELKCPEPKPCPAQQKCPDPKPCPTQQKCKKCDEIRYIKVPALITKTITVDKNGNVISQKIDSGNANAPTTTQYLSPSTTVSANVDADEQNSNSSNSSNSLSSVLLNALYNVSTTTIPQTTQYNSSQYEEQSKNSDMPNTTFPTISQSNPNTTMAQTLELASGSGSFCPSNDLNNDFKKYGIYGM